ncbi:MAG: DUF945 family protein [Burkholderiales bacterium]|nr:DUF945 family protein [Burkholderiales bacterium]
MSVYAYRRTLATLAVAAAFHAPALADEAPAVPAEKPAAEAPAKKVEAEIYNSEVFKTYLAVVREITPLVDESDPRATIQALTTFDFTPDTKQKLAKLFGNDKPLHITATPGDDGGTSVDFMLDPLHYDSEDGKLHADWTGITAKSVYDKTYTHVETNGHSDAFTLSVPDGKQMAVKNITLHGSMRQDAAKLWLGSVHVDADSATIGKPAALVSLSGISAKINILPVAKAKALDIEYDTAINSIGWGSEQAGPVRMDVRLNHVDEQAFVDMKNDSRKLNVQSLSPEERQNQSMQLMMRFGMQALARGVGVDIKNLSVQYHGKEAGITGHVVAKPMTMVELQDYKVASKKVTARVDVYVPMAMALDVATTIFSQVSKGQGSPGLTDDQMHEMAKSMLDGQLKKMQSEHYVRVDKDVIRTTLEFKGGKFLVNGRNVDMPTFKLPAKAAKKG